MSDPIDDWKSTLIKEFSQKPAHDPPSLAEVMRLDAILRTWLEQPSLPRKDYRGCSYHGSRGDEPFDQKEITRMKERMLRIAPTAYLHIFPQEQN